MAKFNGKQKNKPAVKTQGKTKNQSSRNAPAGKRDSRKKQAPLNAEDLDRQLFSYMGESGKKVVLDDQLDTYFHAPAE